MTVRELIEELSKHNPDSPTTVLDVLVRDYISGNSHQLIFVKGKSSL